jgi:dienelactone hydrolase
MYFFTEPGSLSSTINTQYFGPVLFGPIPDPNDPTDLFYTYDKKVFNVTTVFNLTAPAKAFACQDSMMIVQQYVDITTGLINPDLVNIILKPIKGLDISFTPVKYYIYRGLLKSSFISGTAITPDDPNTKTQFITKFWNGWRNQKAVLGQPALPDPTLQSFGFDLTLANATLVEEIFNSDQSANTAVNNLQAIKVDEGEWIGNFGINNIGFEIVIDTENFKVDLEYIRKSNFIIDVTALANVTPVTNESKFNLKSQREVVLNFVDPAAFFGMHIEAGISVAGTNTPKTNDLLYNDIVNKFFNKDCLYINVESEKDFSYNFYDNYGDSSHINVKLSKSTDSIAVVREFDYGVDRFPLIIFRTAAEFQNPDFIRTKLELRLRIDDNLVPLLFFENPKLVGSSSLLKSSNFIDEKLLIDSANAGWTIEIPLDLPTVQFNSAKVNMAYIARLQYFRQKENSASPSTVFKNASYLDAVFGGINLPASNVNTVFNNIKNTKRTLVNGNNFTYVSETGVYIDPDKVVLYANSDFPFRQSREAYPKIDFSAFNFNTLGSKSPVLPKHILYNKWRVDQAVGVTLDIIEIAGYNKDHRPTNVENIYFLGVTRAEFDILKNLTGVSNQHQRYIAFEEIPNQQDITNGTPYKKYKLKIQGLNTDGVVSVVAPATDIFVFGSCLNMLCSKNFSASTDLPNLLPDPGVYKEFKYVEVWKYDKTDPTVLSIPGFSTGVIEVVDKGNEYKDNKPDVELRGQLFFPVDKSGDSSPSQLQSQYPLIVIIHGNGHQYEQYQDLCIHLAYNGFLAVSIDCQIYKAEVKMSSFSNPAYSYTHSFTLFEIPFFYDNVAGTLDFLDTKVSPPILKFSGLAKTTDYTISITSSSQIIRFTRNPFEGSSMASLGRANLLYPHLKIVKEKMGIRVANIIGILGHSRGGQAVVRAAKDISSSASSNLNNLKAVISLAPTDIESWDVENLTQNIPYHVLYGSMDGDVAGFKASVGLLNRTSGFSLWDRANNKTEKSMSFVYGATHNGFITDNHDYKITKFPSYATNILPETKQHVITLAYVNAFFRMHLKNEIVWKPIFKGDHIPLSVQSKEIYQQFRIMNPSPTSQANAFVINDFESGVNIGNSTGQVHQLTAPSSLTEGYLLNISSQTPHDTKGLRVKWRSSDKLKFKISSTGVDISMYKFISFRISHAAKITSRLSETYSASFPTVSYIAATVLYASLDELIVNLADALTDKSLKIPKKIPKPHLRETYTLQAKSVDTKGTPSPLDDEYFYENLTKSALMTVRIPLSDYENQGIDLTKITQLSLIFPSIGSGEIILDDVEFTL